jgi:hypothetical protein
MAAMGVAPIAALVATPAVGLPADSEYRKQIKP